MSLTPQHKAELHKAFDNVSLVLRNQLRINFGLESPEAEFVSKLLLTGTVFSPDPAAHKLLSTVLDMLREYLSAHISDERMAEKFIIESLTWVNKELKIVEHE